MTIDYTAYASDPIDPTRAAESLVVGDFVRIIVHATITYSGRVTHLINGRIMLDDLKMTTPVAIKDLTAAYWDDKDNTGFLFMLKCDLWGDVAIAAAAI